MTIRIHVATASIAAVAVFTAVAPARAGGDKVAFPDNHATGVLFTTVDRADNKQFREFYTSAEALDAAKKGEPLPSGTVITLIQYAAKLDAQGNPEKDADGRFIGNNGAPIAVPAPFKLPDGDGLAVLKRIKEVRPETQVIMMTAFSTVENAVEAMKRGAYH